MYDCVCVYERERGGSEQEASVFAQLPCAFLTSVWQFYKALLAILS